ncbi:DUF4314 domain-containing protein [Microbacterium sp. PI-1]|uniref:DUF4314 domain-containing protein n=1 Tax=unclassified Microbacterium TaxID=2609290 RepID=UPI00103AA04E|nr:MULTISPECIES: DUF4314 domain-containing protein [unclassified Microbacterium]TCJ23782.1 DUF4314 domain-containing protein [Microbacterium sp. PI-1]UUE20079.1 DUF4314 domain-containing protein [Microbacterium sp. J1-1]
MLGPGSRVRLIESRDPISPIPTGTEGSVDLIDDLGTIFVDWDNGRSLGVIPGEDRFERIQ